MAKLKLQQGGEITVPEVNQLFRTTDPDFVYRRTEEGIVEAIPVRSGLGPGGGFSPFTGDVSSLPQYGSNIPTDINRIFGQGVKARGFDPSFLTSPVKLGADLAQEALDPATAALVKAGGATVAGFEAGGEAAQKAALALQTTPEAISNRIRAITGGPIAGESLQPVAPVDFKTPTTAPAPSIAGLDTTVPTAPATITPPVNQFDKQLQDMIDKITTETTTLAGESAFRTQQEEVGGIAELQKTQRDLSARLKAIQNEALAIPIRLQEGAVGRGLTIELLNRQQESLLRNNTIQALGVASLLEASRGNLASALDMVDRATAAKFDPIRDSRDAKIFNLELIMKSPAYTRAEKARADAQLEIQRKAQVKEKLDANNFEAAKKETLKYVGIADSLTLREMQNAKSALDVAQIAERKGLKTLEQQKTEMEIAKITKGLGAPTEITFTGTQTAKGAATADLPIADFQKLDTDTQNFFINNSDQIKAKKKLIDEAKLKKEDPLSIKTEIASSTLPEAVKGSLNRYLDSVFPPQKEESKPWWKRLLGL